MTGDVPWRLVLGPMLFVIYMNKLDENVDDKDSMLAEENKIGDNMDNNIYDKI